jgi:hypothetical protein
MTEADQKRGAVIGAAYRLERFLDANAGHTKDWPIRIAGDSPEIEQLAALLTELKTSLRRLPEKP